MRFGCDTGGTFTDLVVDDGTQLRMFKAHTTPANPVDGMFEALRLSAEDVGETLQAHLARGEYFIHGTTRAINALVTGTAARTALLCTAGHPDTLLFREGGRADAFDHTQPYPEPLVPRSLTFEVPERVTSTGECRVPLDEEAVIGIIEILRERKIEAVAICLLWSIVAPEHELRIAELLDRYLPGVPYTLSHQVNPTLREYRRASSACIDASLKPLMTRYFDSLADRLSATGFAGRLLIATSQGAMLDAGDVARAPIHSLGSGPAMAPVAGRHFAGAVGGLRTAIIADTGGTTYDVSLVRDGQIPWTRETWLGEEHRSHITGFPSVSVRSVGAGGGSIAWIDDGGLVCVGPRSAGSVPGPACYGAGGTEPTLTDACLVLGYIDPDYFLGGTMRLDPVAAADAIDAHVASALNMTTADAAAAIVSIAASNMVHAIEGVTVEQGIDPADAVLVGGGGAAGLNCVEIARRLGCPAVLIPDVGAALSAAGALLSDVSSEFATTAVTATDMFDFESVNAGLAELEAHCAAFVERVGATSNEVELLFDGHYPGQAWEIEAPVMHSRVEMRQHVEELRDAFHRRHHQLFAIADHDAEIEIVAWRARVRCRVSDADLSPLARAGSGAVVERTRPIYVPERGLVDARVVHIEALDGEISGPAIIEAPFTTIVLDAEAAAQRTADGGLVIKPRAGQA